MLQNVCLFTSIMAVNKRIKTIWFRCCSHVMRCSVFGVCLLLTVETMRFNLSKFSCKFIWKMWNFTSHFMNCSAVLCMLFHSQHCFCTHQMNMREEWRLNDTHNSWESSHDKFCMRLSYVQCSFIDNITNSWVVEYAGWVVVNLIMGLCNAYECHSNLPAVDMSGR